MRCHRTLLAGLIIASLTLPINAHAMLLYHLHLLQGSVMASSSSTAQSSSSSTSSLIRPVGRHVSSARRPLRRRVRRSSSSSSMSSLGRIEEIRKRRQILHGLSEADQTTLDTVALLINDARKEQSLPPLQRNTRLDIAAQMHAQDMSERGYFNHASPEGELFPERIKRAGYPEDAPGPGCNCQVFIEYGENIALGQPTAERVVTAWLNSPDHRANILEPGFTDVGYGKVGNYWVQDFGNMRVMYAVAPQHKP